MSKDRYLSEKDSEKFIGEKKAQIDELRRIKVNTDSEIYRTRQELEKSKRTIDEMISKIEGLPDEDAERWIGLLQNEETEFGIKQVNILEMEFRAGSLNALIIIFDAMLNNYKISKSNADYKIIDDLLDCEMIRNNLGNYDTLRRIVANVSEKFKERGNDACLAQEQNQAATQFGEVIDKGKTFDGRSSRLAQIRAAQAAKNALKNELNFDVVKSVPASESDKDTQKNKN